MSGELIRDLKIFINFSFLAILTPSIWAKKINRKRSFVTTSK
jgi:hypothetical protein